MKNIFFLVIFHLGGLLPVYAQQNPLTEQQRKAITELIGQYTAAREKNDTLLLKAILTTDVDQLVSSGEWRTGISAAVKGMLQSTAGTPGTRILYVEKMRLITAGCAIVDCRYEINGKDNNIRKMWSSLIITDDTGNWKISAIRNMLPAGN